MDDVTPSGDRILVRVAFDARLPHYYLLMSSIGIAATIVGIPFLIIWLLGLGQSIHRRQYDALEAELTERSLNIRRGFLFRSQKNIPLDKITDLAVAEGPLLRYLGLCSLAVETAGGGMQGSAMGQAQLPGVVDALAFRDAVIKQRDLVTGHGIARAVAPAAATAAPVDDVVLRDVRDTLQRIETLLDERLPRDDAS